MTADLCIWVGIKNVHNGILYILYYFLYSMLLRARGNENISVFRQNVLQIYYFD